MTNSFGPKQPKLVRKSLDLIALERLFGDETKLGFLIEDGREYLPGYGPLDICTNSAQFVVDNVGGLVVGFAEGTNPGAHKDFLDGHDFALVNGRYIVDIWAHVYLGFKVSADLLHPGDRRRTLPRYGDLSKWDVQDFSFQTGRRPFSPTGDLHPDVFQAIARHIPSTPNLDDRGR